MSVAVNRSAQPVHAFIEQTVRENPVALFMKVSAPFPRCGFPDMATQLLKTNGVTRLATVNVLDDDEVRQGVQAFSNWPTVLQLFVNGEFVGGSDIMGEMHESGELQKLLATVA